MKVQEDLLYSDFIKSPKKTIKVLLQDKELKDNSLMRKYEHETKDISFKYVQDFILAMMFSKFATIVSHWKRTLALSAPRNFKSSLLKYGIIPLLCAEWYDKKRWNTLKEECQDLKDSELNSKYIALTKTK